MDPACPEPEAIGQAAQIIRRGGLVAFPTETVYGLGADALNPLAVGRIFQAKGRPADNPVIVHIAGAEDLEAVAARVPEQAWRLAYSFWPGPLTLVLPRARRVPEVTTGGLKTVAVRVPAHPVALALILASGCPIAAPSANRSGRASPTSAAHVMEDLAGRVEMVLDGGPCPVGVESTVLDLTEDPPILLRPGAVPQEALEATIGEIRTLQRHQDAAKRSPGARYRHYAPRARLLLVGPGEAESLASRLLREGQKIGVIAQRHLSLESPKLVARVMPQGLAEYAHILFATLRDMDAAGCDVIVAEAVATKGLGQAIMDRLRRASSPSAGADNS